MKENNNNDLKLFEALNHLRKSVPHIYSIMDLTNIELNQNDIPTASVSWDKKAKKFLIKVGNLFSNDLDSRNLSAVLEHELYHILFEHLFDETMPDKKRANVAMDSIINDSIELFRNDKADKILDSRVKLKDINKAFNISNNTSLDVYKYLGENPEKMPENGNGLDDHGGFSNNDDNLDGAENSDLSNGLEKEIAKAVLKNHIEKNLDSFQTMGRGHADLDRLIKEKLKVEYNFKTIFSNAIKKTLRDETKKTWKKPSRRLGNIVKGIKKSNVPNVLLVIDTSGSINDEILKKVNWQVDFLSKFYSFTICWGDDSLEGQLRIKKGQKPKINYSGYGGTDLSFYKELTEKENFDLIIFNTDGYIPEIDPKCPIKKIFCIYENGQLVKGYKNIMLK